MAVDNNPKIVETPYCLGPIAGHRIFEMFKYSLVIKKSSIAGHFKNWDETTHISDLLQREI